VNTSSNSFNIILVVRQELTVNAMDYQTRALDEMFVVTFVFFLLLDILVLDYTVGYQHLSFYNKRAAMVKR
jgi:hypothetical protein